VWDRISSRVSDPLRTSIRFGDVVNGKSRKDSVTIVNTGIGPLVINSISTSKSVFTVSPNSGTIAPFGSMKVYVTFAPPLRGFLQWRDLFFMNNTAKGKDSILVDGNGTGVDIKAVFTVSPSLLNFDSVQVGTTKVDTLRVTNTGNTRLNITDVNLLKSSSGQFTVWPDFGMLYPGDTEAFAVTFTPTSTGLKQDTVRFYHDAAGGLARVAISGIGYGARAGYEIPRRACVAFLRDSAERNVEDGQRPRCTTTATATC